MIAAFPGIFYITFQHPQFEWYFDLRGFSQEFPYKISVHKLLQAYINTVVSLDVDESSGDV